jgi:hypothetical protein
MGMAELYDSAISGFVMRGIMEGREKVDPTDAVWVRQEELMDALMAALGEKKNPNFAVALIGTVMASGVMFQVRVGGKVSKLKRKSTAVMMDEWR